MAFTAFSFYFYCLSGFVLEIIHCMKKVLVGLIMAVMLIAAPSCKDYKKPVEGILRIHIRASSDSACDQEIKLAVRDCVVEYLSPILRGIENATEAENVIYKHKNEMENKSGMEIRNIEEIHENKCDRCNNTACEFRQQEERKK